MVRIGFSNAVPLFLSFRRLFRWENELYYENSLRKAREYTDASYFWGMDEREKRMRDQVLAERGSQSGTSEGKGRKAERQ